MRTAEEIINKVEETFTDIKFKSYIPYEIVIKAINEARKEAIEECATIASNYVLNERTPEHDDVHFLVIALINKLK